ncbi:MAG: AmmeMemoRadiSam system protein B [Rhodocyclaceae bacterium]|nr:AmmeMemoRadiSam system protein B [Rhodocyclaceae bacterium]
MHSLQIRPPAVAGLFYPDDPDVLSGEITALLDEEAVPPAPTLRQPKALIAPHAGYIYSGPIAASAYRRLKPYAETIRRVVLFGPCHRVAVRGLAVPRARAFATPLGTISLDEAALATALELPQVIAHDAAHAEEHSLEVHLPFLQSVLEDFTLAPFAVGFATPDEVAEVMERLWGGPETLIVVSSDLSHYRGYLEAQRLDGRTAEEIKRLHLLTDHEQACGATPINGLIEVAQRRGLKPELLDLRNSGDTAGDKSRVVGYASFAFYAPEAGHA